jgi:hypothetical protein
MPKAAVATVEASFLGSRAFSRGKCEALCASPGPRGPGPSSEGVRNTLHLPSALGNDVEADFARAELRVRRQPGFGGMRDAPRLLGGDHLERIAQSRPALRLHLAEDDRPAAADDEVELVASRPGVGRQNPVPAQPVVPERTPLGTRPDGTRARPL